MFISGGISIVILSFALCSNALNITLDTVNSVCKAEKQLYSSAEKLTSAGSNIFKALIINDDAEKLTVIAEQFCQNKNSSYNRLGKTLPKDLLNTISSIAGCTKRSEAILKSHCDRVKGVYQALNSILSKSARSNFEQIVTDLVALDVSLFPSISVSKLKNLSLTLADQNQLTIESIVNYATAILDIYRSV